MTLRNRHQLWDELVGILHTGVEQKLLTEMQENAARTALSPIIYTKDTCQICGQIFSSGVDRWFAIDPNGNT